MSVRSPSRFLRLFILALSIGVFVPQALCAQGVAELLRTPDDAVVSRSEFLRAAVNALKIPLSSEPATGFKRVPKNMGDIVSTAAKRGSLSVFGSDLALGRGIDRGQALQVLVALQGLKAEPVAGYRDVTIDAEARAVKVALDRHWMEAQSTSTFGVRTLLTGKAGRVLLRKVIGEAEALEPVSDTPPTTVRIRLAPAPSNQLELPRAGILQAIWRLLNSDYLRSENINSDKAAYAAAEALVKSLGDPYSSFMRPASAAEFQTQLSGEVSGIGAQVEEKSGILTIVSPFPNSPAEKAGLKPGDQVIAADGESIVNLGLQEEVNKVRGPTGSSVVLRIRRDGAEFDVTVIRETIKVPEVEINWQGDVVVIRLLQFGKIAQNELRPALAIVQKKNPAGIVLDLRSNPGGLLHAADSVLSNFLPKDSVVAQIRERQEQHNEVTDQAPTIDPSVPMVVLVNEGSASAAEIVAGALQDASRATIIGVKSFGKGTVQEVVEFTDGSSLKLTIAEWRTPAGRVIDGKGVMPDVVVKNSDRDEQMMKALDVLRSRGR